MAQTHDLKKFEKEKEKDGCLITLHNQSTLIHTVTDFPLSRHTLSLSKFTPTQSALQPLRSALVSPASSSSASLSLSLSLSQYSLKRLHEVGSTLRRVHVGPPGLNEGRIDNVCSWEVFGEGSQLLPSGSGVEPRV